LKIIQYFNNFKYQSGLGWRKIQSSRGCQNWFVPCCLQLDDPGTTVLRCQKHSSSVPRAIIITSTSRERHALVMPPQNARDLGRCSRTNPTHTHTHTQILLAILPLSSRFVCLSRHDYNHKMKLSFLAFPTIVSVAAIAGVEGTYRSEIQVRFPLCFRSIDTSLTSPRVMNRTKNCVLLREP
jgi:hypothetical protein